MTRLNCVSFDLITTWLGEGAEAVRSASCVMGDLSHLMFVFPSEHTQRQNTYTNKTLASVCYLVCFPLFITAFLCFDVSIVFQCGSLVYMHCAWL